MSASLDSASASISSRASFAPFTGSASATVQCSLGGSLSADGSYEVNDTSERYDLHASFDQCSEREGTIDGALHLEEYVDPTVVRDNADGVIDFTDARGAWSCAFNYSLVVDATSTRYAGMFCGYTVTELDLPN